MHSVHAKHSIQWNVCFVSEYRDGVASIPSRINVMTWNQNTKRSRMTIASKKMRTTWGWARCFGSEMNGLVGSLHATRDLFDIVQQNV